MINIFAISGITTFITSSVMALVLFQKLKPLSSILGFFCLTVMMWGIGVFNIGTAEDPGKAIIWWKIAYMGVIFIPTTLTHFVHVFLDIEKTLFIPIIYLISVLYLYANIFTDVFISGVHLVFNQFYYLSPSYLYNSFVVFFFFLVIYSHVLLIRRYRTVEGLQKRQIQYFFLGTFVGFFGGGFSFLPVYNINIYPYLNNTVFLFPVFMGYAVIKYNLTNIKVVATELFIFSLWAFLAIRIFFAKFGSTDQIADLILLLFSVIIGILLIMSVIKEIRTREKMGLLAQSLEKLNNELKERTVQLEKSKKEEVAKAQEVARLKDEFVFLATHELRTPVTAIRGFLELTEGARKHFPKDLQKKFTAISQASDHLDNLINDLLEVARSESGSMVINVGPNEFEPVLNKVLEEISPLIEEKEIKVESKVAPLPPVLFDPVKMKEVLINLIGNAVKYNKKGGSIYINAYRYPEEKSFVFEIHDTGYGIPKDRQGKIFEKFFRAGTKGTEETIGTGLGLFITRILVEKMGGTMLFSSVEQEGTTFSFSLPLAEDPS